MAIVKIKFVRYAKSLLRYVIDGRAQNDPIATHNCDSKSMAEDFEAIKQFEKGKGAVDAIHIMQSWNENESKLMPAEEFNAMGRALVEQQFPGHAYAVVTHTDTGKNHIVVSPWHSETGKKIENKKHHLYDLRNLNDEICKERGLSVVNGLAKDRQKRLPEKVQKIAKFNGKSWLFDLYQKSDFARSYATSYDEYITILGEMGVKARVEEKNITYFYSAKARPKRGSKMGQAYDKAGLEKAFHENDLKFSSISGLKEKISGELSSPTLIEKSYTSQVAKNYSVYSKTERPGRILRFPHEMETSGSIIPIEELRRARNTNIVSYCRENNIALVGTEGGKYTLKGRSFVEISDFEWVNKRNRTKGSLIELVAAHKNKTYLQAVAEITGNDRLLLLEQHYGETKRAFTSFYIPKQNQIAELDAKVKIAKLLITFDIDPQHAATLFKSKQMQVSQEGRIRLFGKEDAGGAFEFTETDDRKWKREKIGTITKSFFSVSGSSRKVVVYLDPFSFLKHEGKHALWPAKYNHDIVVLMEPEAPGLEHHLAANRHIKEIEIFHNGQEKSSEPSLNFFHSLQTKYRGFGISVTQTNDLSRTRSRELEMPSM